MSSENAPKVPGGVKKVVGGGVLFLAQRSSSGVVRVRGVRVEEGSRIRRHHQRQPPLQAVSHLCSLRWPPHREPCACTAPHTDVEFAASTEDARRA